MTVSRTTWGWVAAGTLGFSAWRLLDAYKGHRVISQQKIDTNNYLNDLDDIKYDWGRYSGSPDLDRASGWFNRLKVYGPLQIRQHYQNFKTRVGSFLNNVLFPNLIPLGVGGAALCGAIGSDNLKAMGRRFGSWWNGSSFFSNYFNPTMKRVIGSTWNGLTNGLASLLKVSFKSPQHFAIASGIGLVSAFFLKRFNDSNNGNAQAFYYKDSFTPNYR